MEVNLASIKELLTEENILYWLQEYRDLGPLPGILLPMAEALLPILPLVLFVAGNAAAYGLWLGVLYSWLGTVLGSIGVFFIIRRLAKSRYLKFVARSKKVKTLLEWIEKKGFGPLFLIFCFPFTPSALINVVAGLSQIHIRTFILAVALGKFVMIFILSYIGQDFLDLINEPIKMAIVAAVILILWLAGKKIENRLKQPIQQNEELEGTLKSRD